MDWVAQIHKGIDKAEDYPLANHSDGGDGTADATTGDGPGGAELAVAGMTASLGEQLERLDSLTLLQPVICRLVNRLWRELPRDSSILVFLRGRKNMAPVLPTPVEDW